MFGQVSPFFWVAYGALMWGGVAEIQPSHLGLYNIKILLIRFRQYKIPNLYRFSSNQQGIARNLLKFSAWLIKFLLTLLFN